MKESQLRSAMFLAKMFASDFYYKVEMESTVLLFWFEFSLFALQLAINRVLVLIKNDQLLDKAQIQVESIQHKENA